MSVPHTATLDTQPTTQLALFDYAALDSETRIVVQQRTSEIKGLMRRAAQDIIEIGQKLIEVKARLGHGHFGAWLKAEFEWSWDTAKRFMRTAEVFKNQQIADFAPSALYLLAAPSTPDEARAEALARAEAGEPITYSAAREIVADYRQPEPATAPQHGANGANVARDGALPFEPDDLDNEPLDSYEARIAAQYTPPIAPQFVADDEDDDLTEVEIQKGVQWLESQAAEMGIAHLVDVVPSVQSVTLADHQRINASTNNEWYTPAAFVNAAREVMGGIDLDPASCAFANDTVQALRYYTAENDGFAQPWHGRVWMNPPYGREDGESNQNRWTARLIAEYEQGNVTEACMLVNAVPGNAWFAPLWAYPICFVARRIRFYNEDIAAGQPTHSNAIIYLGPNRSAFARVFRRFGPVVLEVASYTPEVGDATNI